MAKVLFYSAAPYVIDSMKEPMETAFPGRVKFTDVRCCADTAVMAQGFEAICNFVNDECDAETVEKLSEVGVKLVLLRCMGFDRVDLKACENKGIKVARVPAYSPHSVAEQVVALVMCLNRKIHKCHLRTREGNFTLSGLVGFDLYGKTLGIVGTGQLGQRTAQKFLGFEMKYVCYDVYENDTMKDKFQAKYMPVEEVFATSDIVTLHAPLMDSTHHMVNAELLAKAKPGLMLINCARGGLLDTQAVIDALKSGKLSAYGMDVYENEGPIFFRDFTALDPAKRMKHWDSQLAELRALPNVIITPHSAFLTQEALKDISDVTIKNFQEYCDKAEMTNEVKPPK